MATPIPHNQAGFTLREMAEICRGTVAAGEADRRTEGVAIDSRAVARGNLFVAIRGENTDGHRFVEAALQAGAGALMVERGASVPSGASIVEVDDTMRALGDLAAAHRARWKGRVVAITGSVGKTTAKEFTAAALRGAGARVLASTGNLNNLVGLPMSLLLLESDFEVAVVELGTSQPGEIARLSEIARPDIGVVTLVALAHAEGLGSIEAVAREKASLLTAIPAAGAAIHNADCSSLKPLLPTFRARTVLSFGESENADVRLVSHEVDARLVNHCRYELKEPPLSIELQVKVPGKGAAMSGAVALSVVLAHSGRENLEGALSGLRSVQPVAGRLRPVPGPRETLFLDDTYNSNPESAIVSLSTAARVADAIGGRAVAILGDMAELGEHSRSEHEKVGRAAVRTPVGVLIACGREMAAASEAAALESAGLLADRRTRVVHVANPLEAIGVARDIIRQRDVVLIKGSRCMEMERVLSGLAAQPGAAS